MSKQMMAMRTAEAAPQFVDEFVDAARFPRLQATLRGAGGGAWLREASLALALAAQAHIQLDEEALIYSDVRDLMALQHQLRGAHARR